MNEHSHFGVAITTPSKYHRYSATDDIRYFHYQVTPRDLQRPKLRKGPMLVGRTSAKGRLPKDCLR